MDCLLQEKDAEILKLRQQVAELALEKQAKTTPTVVVTKPTSLRTATVPKGTWSKEQSFQSQKRRGKLTAQLSLEEVGSTSHLYIQFQFRDHFRYSGLISWNYRGPSEGTATS